MKWGPIFGITFIVILIALYEWPKINSKQKKEKAAFVILALLGWLLTIVVLYNPDIPGPTQMIHLIFKPLGKMIE